MGRQVNPNVPEDGYVSKKLFNDTGSICSSDFAVVDDATAKKKLVFDPSSQAAGSTYTIKTPATAGAVILTLPSASGTLVTTATETNSFSIIQPDAGTSPTASSPTDTLTLTSSDGSATITGNATTKTINIQVPTITKGNLTDAGTDGITVTNGTNAVIGSGTSIAQQKSDASHNGYLSSTDWTTFNNKANYTTTSNSASWTLDNVTGYTCNVTYSVIGKLLVGQIAFSPGGATSGTFAINIPAGVGTISTTYPSSITFHVGTLHRAVNTQATPATSNGPFPLWVDPNASTSKIFCDVIYASSTSMSPGANATQFIGTQFYTGTFLVQLA